MTYDQRVRNALETARREGRKGRDLDDRVKQLLEIDKLDVGDAVQRRELLDLADSYNRIVKPAAAKPAARKTDQPKLFV